MEASENLQLPNTALMQLPLWIFYHALKGENNGSGQRGKKTWEKCDLC